MLWAGHSRLYWGYFPLPGCTVFGGGTFSFFFFFEISFLVRKGKRFLVSLRNVRLVSNIFIYPFLKGSSLHMLRNTLLNVIHHVCETVGLVIILLEYGHLRIKKHAAYACAEMWTFRGAIQSSLVFRYF